MAVSMDPAVVIKIKYAETVRRFTAPVVDGKLDLSMNELREKIIYFFNFSRDSEFIVTYLDKDNDVITMADEDDLIDVVRQGLNPLRITVNLSTEGSGQSSPSYRTSGLFTQFGSPLLQQLVQNLNSQDPLSRFFTECIRLMNQSFPGAPAHGLSPSGNETVTSDPCGPKINNAGKSRVTISADTASTWSDNQSEKVLKTDEPKRSVREYPSLITAPQADLYTNKSIEQPPAVGAAPVSKNVPLETEIASGVLGSLGSSSGKSSSRRGSEVKLRVLGNYKQLGNYRKRGNFRQRENHGQRGNPAMTFHSGVRCDGCGMLPITGVRFISSLKENYDLCSTCFGKMGNEGDFIRIEAPIPYIKGSIELPTQIHCNLDSCFIQDISISDGTLMAPSTQFTKIWRMKNNGTVVWPKGTQLVWCGGDQLTHLFSVELEIPTTGLPVGNELDIAIDFVAPRQLGHYISYWRMVSPNGHKFGQRVWVLIQVDANELPPSFFDFNLNLPPVSNGTSNPVFVSNRTSNPVFVSNGASNAEALNVNSEPMVKDSVHELGHIESSSSNGTADLVEGLAALLVQKEEQVNLPINDRLFVGGAVPVRSASAPSSSVTCPMVDLCDTAIDDDLLEPAASPPPRPVPSTVDCASCTDLGLEPGAEEMLLKELDEMGFKDLDLNKEVLRANKYDMEKSLDYLCVMVEWDPILEELNEMGFCDKHRNRELLRKNNGSVKLVVMDLLGSENM